MRTTIDIPDELYRELKGRAAAQGGTVKQLLLRGVETVLREPILRTPRVLPRLKTPLIVGGEPGSLKIDNAMIDDILYDLHDLP